MSVIPVSDLRKGLKIELDGMPYIVTDFDFCKPGKGQALYRCKLKNMINGSGMERTWRSADRVETPNLSNREVHYSYAEGDFYVFSDSETYEEYRVPASTLGDQRYFLIENADCEILFFNDKPIEITLPIFIEKQIVHTEPGVRGDTANNTLKPAKIDNGYEIMVPLFVNQGDWVKIDTRTGTYNERILNKK